MEYIEKHPSYGLIGINRVIKGNNLLFGSNVRGHCEIIELVIYNAGRTHGMSRDWICRYDTQPVIKIEMSPVQFSQLLMSINMPDGIPCTIRNVNGKEIDDIPLTYKLEHETIGKRFEEELGDIIGSIKHCRGKINNILKKKSISKVDRHVIVNMVDMIFDHFEGNSVFIMDSFNKSVENVITEAKLQIEEYIINLNTIGLKKFKNLFGFSNLEDK